MIIESSEVDIHVGKAYVDRSIVILNDSLMLPSYTKLEEGVKDDSFSYQQALKFKLNIADINAPYLLIKDSNSWIIKLVKKQDTLIFRLPDPNEKNPLDPTFSDLYDALFTEK
jgi:hypothetical protein